MSRSRPSFASALRRARSRAGAGSAALGARVATWPAHGTVRPIGEQFCPAAMTTVRPTRCSDFDFALPPELIAQHPAAERSASRLLDGRAGRAGRPRVPRPARRCCARRPAGLQRHARHQGAPARRQGQRRRGRGAGRARAAGPRSRLAHLRASKSPQAGQPLRFADAFDAEVLGRGRAATTSLFRLRFPDDPLALLERHGHVPLPPYITHADDADDERALPDRVRRAARRGRGADRGAALRRRAARRARRARRRSAPA